MRALNEEKERIERLTKDQHIESILNSFKEDLNYAPSIQLKPQIKFENLKEADPIGLAASLNPMIDLSQFNKPTESTINTSLDKSDQSICIIEDDCEIAEDPFNSIHSSKSCIKEEYKEICEIDLEADDLNEIIEYNHSDDDDCMIISENENMPMFKPKVSRGVHMNDELNTPNENGQVLVNMNHPADDRDIFLLPYLSRNVKSHQIGGIRFMYDNIVESLTRIKDKSTGFGCILAHAMGLGKTLQIVSFVEVFLRCTGVKNVLCIVPINTIQNWLSEFNNWLPENGQHRLDNDTVINYRRPFKVFLINEYSKTAKQRSEVIRKLI